MPFATIRRLALLAAVLQCSNFPAVAQVAPSLPTSPTGTPEAAVVLSPFEVAADQDKGYAASSALTGTRTNEKLANLPNSITVVTADLLSDLAITDFYGAVDFAVGAENVYNDAGTVGTPIASYGTQINFRGIPSTHMLRDGFPWFVPGDNYNTERIEFARGPNGLAYGDIDPSGTINVTTKRAQSRRSASTTVRYDNFGTRRYSVDINQPLHSRLAVRLNALNSDVEQFRQRANRGYQGFALAARWEPFQNRRTRIDLSYEGGHTRLFYSTLQLSDTTTAYVRGSGTNAADADPVAPGVQANGVGMRRFSAPGAALRVHYDIGGTLHDMQSTATATFRNSVVITSAAAATGADPQNPRRLPLLPASYSLSPEGKDWAGPDNRSDTEFFGYNVELSHAFGDHLSVLFGHNGQANDTTRMQAVFNGGASTLGTNIRGFFIDVNRVLPHPTIPNATIPNPRFEQLYVAQAPLYITDGNKAVGWRTSAVYDTKLPFWSSSLRLVAGASYRRERNYSNNFRYALTQQEIARRGFTGAAATFDNNQVHPIHYLADGNSDEALRLRVIPGVTGFYRTTAQPRFDQTLGSGNLTALGTFFKERLHTSAAVGRDYFRQNRNHATSTNPATGEVQLTDLQGRPMEDNTGYDLPYEPFNRTYATNQTYGGVLRITPWLALGAGYFESSLFTDSATFELSGKPRLPRTGEGREFSLRFNLLKDRITATVTRFLSVAENNALALSAAAQSELNALLPANLRLQGTGDYRDQETRGWEVEMLTNLTRQLTVRATYSMNQTFYSRFFPLVRPYLAAAQDAAKARGLDPEVATNTTLDLIENTEGAVRAVRRETASVVARYSFAEGKLAGFSIGTSASYAMGKPRAAVSVGGVVVLPAMTTDDYVLVNPFASYRRKVFGRAATFQLNVNNVFNLRSDQGNNYNWPRLTDPRRITSTVTINW